MRAVLLFCGILSSLLHVAGDVYRGVRYEGYSFASPFMLWNAVLAIALLRDPGKPLRRNVPA